MLRSWCETADIHGIKGGHMTLSQTEIKALIKVLGYEPKQKTVEVYQKSVKMR